MLLNIPTCVLNSALCMQHCLNGGTCSQPDVCECKPGWIGDGCETGKMHKNKAMNAGN